MLFEVLLLIFDFETVVGFTEIGNERSTRIALSARLDNRAVLARIRDRVTDDVNPTY